MATRQHRLTKIGLAVIAVTLCFIKAPASADEVITLNPRSGVTQAVLLWGPSPSEPQVLLLVFPGGGGNVGFETTNGKVIARTGYLFWRQRDLLQRPEVAVAVVDAPSDQPDMDSEFRRSARHFEDMAAVVGDLKSRYPKARLVLLGHSRGTVSAAYVAQALSDRVAAVILMSGFYDRYPRRGVGLSEFDFDALKTPLLIVHHVKDRCPNTLFASARKLTERFPAIVVDGPDATRPDQPCAPGTNHFFAGREQEANRRRRSERHRRLALVSLAPHQPRPPRDAAYALERGGVVAGPGGVQAGARAAGRDSPCGMVQLDHVAAKRTSSYSRCGPPVSAR